MASDGSPGSPPASIESSHFPKSGGSGGSGSGSGNISSSSSSPWLHIRREPFEFGVLPIPALVHKDDSAAVESLRSLRARLLALARLPEYAASSSSGEAAMIADVSPRINSKALAASMNLPEEHARLVVDTLAAVLPTDVDDDVDPLSQVAPSDVDTVGADVDQLLLFLYLQRYKRAVQRAAFRDPTAMADVWPQGPSPFDAVSPTAASALQLKTSLAARQRSLPGQVEEETNQLSFVQKHLPSLVSLLSDTSASGEEEVISIDKFDLFGLILRTGRVGSSAARPLSQAAPFFRSSSSPSFVPLSTALSWLSARVCYTSDHGPDRPPISPSTSLKEREKLSSSSSASDSDLAEAAAAASSSPAAAAALAAAAAAALSPTVVAAGERADGDGQALPMTPGGSVGQGGMNGVGVGATAAARKVAMAGAGVTNVDGVAKTSVLKVDGEVDNGSVRIGHCHDAVVYVLAPLKYASVVGCSDSIIVLGPVGRAVRVEACERIQLICPCARIRIANSRECVLYLGTNSPPLVCGDNHNIQLAPYNTFYPKLDFHLAKSRVLPSVNQWDAAVCLAGSSGGSLEPPSPRPSGASEADDTPVPLPPEKFAPFVIPFRGQSEGTGGGGSPLLHQQTRSNPFQLPKAYLAALQQKSKVVESLRHMLKTAALEDNRKKELTNVIQAYFKDWLQTSGNIRQIYDLARLDRDS